MARRKRRGVKAATRRELNDRYWNSTDTLVSITKKLRISSSHARQALWSLYLRCPKCEEVHRVASRKARSELGSKCLACSRKWEVVSAPAPEYGSPGFYPRWRAWYKVYLTSPVWRSTASRIKARDGHRCRLCNSPDCLQVHHRTYERVGKEEDTDLVTLCDECHELFHKHRKLVRG